MTFKVTSKSSIPKKYKGFADFMANATHEEKQEVLRKAAENSNKSQHLTLEHYKNKISDMTIEELLEELPDMIDDENDVHEHYYLQINKHDLSHSVFAMVGNKARLDTQPGYRVGYYDLVSYWHVKFDSVDLKQALVELLSWVKNENPS